MKKKVLILIMILLTLSGCTKRFTIDEGENNKKSYVSNILCKPESEELK